MPAKWVPDAENITDRPSTWSDYLTAGQLSAIIGLRSTTILDSLTRHPDGTDPRAAINQPAAYIGHGKASRTPLWHPEQAENYLDMARAKEERTEVKELPVITPAEAAERGLATVEELVEITGRPDSSLRRWARENRTGDDPFPAEQGVAARVPPFQIGPPRKLRDVEAVRAWIQRNSSRLPATAVS